MGSSSGGVKLRHHLSIKEYGPSFHAKDTLEDAVCKVKHTTALSFVNLAGSAGLLESHVESAVPVKKHDTSTTYDNVHSDTTPDGVAGNSPPNMLGVTDAGAEPPSSLKSPNAIGVCTSPSAGWRDAAVVPKKSCG